MSSQIPLAINPSTQLNLVRDSRRRLALKALAATKTPLTLRDLATGVVTREHDASLPDVPADAVSAVYISLAHRHLPKLVDAGVIDYDATREHIKEVDLERLEPTLSTVTGVDTK